MFCTQLTEYTEPTELRIGKIGKLPKIIGEQALWPGFSAMTR
jgi:hypothetical protein